MKSLFLSTVLGLSINMWFWRAGQKQAQSQGNYANFRLLQKPVYWFCVDSILEITKVYRQKTLVVAGGGGREWVMTQKYTARSPYGDGSALYVDCVQGYATRGVIKTPKKRTHTYMHECICTDIYICSRIKTNVFYWCRFPSFSIYTISL